MQKNIAQIRVHKRRSIQKTTPVVNLIEVFQAVTRRMQAFVNLPGQYFLKLLSQLIEKQSFLIVFELGLRSQLLKYLQRKCQRNCTTV